MDTSIVNKLSKYAKLFAEKKFIESGYIAVREADGIAITVAKADLNAVKEEDVVFVNDKNIESHEGNFRAAAVICFCAIRQDKAAEAAAIVDSDAILKYSCKRKPLQPVLDGVAKLLGVTVKCASKNVAAEIVPALSGYRNACFMPDAGAIVKARSLEELFRATEVLDKACNAEILAEDKGGTQHINPINALIEQTIYKMKTAKKVEAQTSDVEVKSEKSADKANETEMAESQEQGESVEVEEIKPQENENQDANYCDITMKAVLQDGKVAALCCPYFVGAAAAIGKPVVMTDEFKEQFGEEIACLPSKMILSEKALAKYAEGASEVQIAAQHGALIVAGDEDEIAKKVEELEKALQAYFAA